MTTFLLRLFVKDYTHTENPAVRSAIGKFAGLAGIVCNMLLFLGKLLVGWSIHSVAIVADAVNNLSDASSSVVTLLGFRLAQQPADADHPYGHARYEYLSGLAVAFLILLIGVELIKSSIEKILHPAAVEFSAVTIGILLGSIVIKLWMSVFFRSLGNRIQSTTLQATAVDSRNDVIATAAVLFGFLAGHFLKINIDGYIGVVVAAFILYSGVEIAKETISPLLGKQADAELIENLTKLVLSQEKVLGIHDLLIHDYGPGQCFASIHAELSAEEDPMQCHECIDKIECLALTELNVHLVIHYDPVQVNDVERKELQQMVEKILQEIHPALSMHDFRMVHGGKQSKLVFDLAVPYGLQMEQQKWKEQIETALLEQGKVYTVVIRFEGKA